MMVRINFPASADMRTKTLNSFPLCSLAFRAPNMISLNEWHSIRVTRNRKEGSLQVDRGPVVQAVSMVRLF